MRRAIFIFVLVLAAARGPQSVRAKARRLNPRG